MIYIMKILKNSKIFFLILILISLITSNCNNKKNNLIEKPEKIPPLDILYKNAFDSYLNNRTTDAIELFQKVETRYFYSEWAQKATLMIIYLHYDLGNSYETIEYIKKFKKLYPKSKNLDYVDYISALTYYENIDVVSRDQSFTRQALKEFKLILKKYPNSQYAEDVKFKINLVNEQLAGKEMYIARYYMKKSKWIPAIKRLMIIINEYDTTIFSEEALHRLVEIYYNLGNIKEAKKYASILGYNYNDGDWYKKSFKIVADKNYKIENQKKKRKLKDRIIKLFKFSK